MCDSTGTPRRPPSPFVAVAPRLPSPPDLADREMRNRRKSLAGVAYRERCVCAQIGVIITRVQNDGRQPTSSPRPGGEIAAIDNDGASRRIGDRDVYADACSAHDTRCRHHANARHRHPPASSAMLAM